MFMICRKCKFITISITFICTKIVSLDALSLVQMSNSSTSTNSSTNSSKTGNYNTNTNSW